MWAARFRIDNKHYRPLGEVDDAFRPINSLNGEQRRKAVVSDIRGNIATGPGNDSRVSEPTKPNTLMGDAIPKWTVHIICESGILGAKPAESVQDRTCPLSREQNVSLGESQLAGPCFALRSVSGSPGIGPR